MELVSSNTTAEIAVAVLPPVKERGTNDVALTTDFQGFVGTSYIMRRLYTLIRNGARSAAPIFISGESGTGKELAAEAIHRESDRCDKPFEALNCAAIPSELMESELFGHTRGAFTGATHARSGAAERAHGGTLFLDELCELAPELQSKLLRFLQTGSIQKVGANNQAVVDVRIVCATNVDPVAALNSGQLREDLFYRLFVVPVNMPALRKRGDDILLLAQHFLRANAFEEEKNFTAFDPAAEEWLLDYHWPGNVRELQNVVRNLVVMNDGPFVTATMLNDCRLVTRGDRSPYLHAGQPEAVTSSSHLHEVNPDELRAEPTPENRPSLGPLWKFERDIIERTIRYFKGNIARAAASLEISPSTIYRKRQTWNDENED